MKAPRAAFKVRLIRFRLAGALVALVIQLPFYLPKDGRGRLREHRFNNLFGDMVGHRRGLPQPTPPFSGFHGKKVTLAAFFPDNLSGSRDLQPLFNPFMRLLFTCCHVFYPVFIPLKGTDPGFRPGDKPLYLT
jgi:hypothetical protein